MEGLPADLLRLILLRVPLASLAGSARRVCRSWRALVDDDPSFARDLLSFSPSGYISRHGLRLGCSIARLLTYVSATDRPKPTGETEMAWSMAAHPFNSSCAVEQSHHGLLLVTRGEERLPAYLWNPLLGERTPLPEGSNEGRLRYHSGFGFDPSAGLYKVFRMGYHSVCAYREVDFLCEVCTVGVGQRPTGWRRIAGPVGLSTFVGAAVPVDGRLYWIATSCGRRTLVSVDVRTETFAELGGLPRGTVWKAACMGGRLALQVQWPNEVWAMREHGTWTKECGTPRLYRHVLTLLGSWKDGAQLYRHVTADVCVLYDPATGQAEKVLTSRDPSSSSYPCTGLLPFTPSLVSLRRRPRRLVPPPPRRCHLVSLPRRCHQREGEEEEGHRRKGKRRKSDQAPLQREEEDHVGRTPPAVPYISTIKWHQRRMRFLPSNGIRDE